MHENLKGTDRREFRIYQQDSNVYKTVNDYETAVEAYKNGNVIYEHRIIRYSMEWAKVDQTLEYEWHPN